ncbi:MAG: hypothetical protein QG656_1628, partial [Candidatus Hydrogenedentes bacterium]|nr:hypothetical protein [Candidatus Hydrogenedentota bacterium]
MNKKTGWIVYAAGVCAVAIVVGGLFSVARAAETLDEAGLIAVLQSNAGWQVKHMACRALQQVGTGNAVPALAALLPDATLSHMARFALEPMPYPEAGKALRDALAVAQGAPKMGVVISLGVRRDREAVPLLIPLLTDPDADMVRATAGALGRIASPEAAQALRAFRATAPDAVKPALADGLLAAAERLAEAGQASMASTMCQELMAPEESLNVRMGAFRGLAYAEPEQAPARLVAALGGDDPLFRDMAAQIVAETTGAAATQQYARALNGLPAEGQVALLRGLANRKDAEARNAVAQAAQSPDMQIKLAAIQALGTLGAIEDIPVLVGMLASDNADLAAAAMASLTVLPGDAVSPMAAAMVPEVVPPVRAQLLELLIARRAEQALPLSVECLADTDAAVRLASLRVLGLTGGTEQVPATVAALAKAADAAEIAAAEKSLSSICGRGGADSLPAVLDAMNGAALEQRLALMRVAARVGGPVALERVLASMADTDTAVSSEAVRVLSDWPTLDAAPHLLELAKSADLNRQVLGLRGYVRLARIEPSPEAKAGMLTTAMGLAARPDEKKLVVAAWGTLPS